MRDRAPEVFRAWVSVATLAGLLSMSQETVRRKIKAGLFGPPAGELDSAHRYVIQDGGDIRVSSSGYDFYVRAHVFEYGPEIKARNQAELRRKLAIRESAA